MPSEPITVIIADDQRVAGTAADGAEAIALAAEHDADVVLMDLRMPGVDGVQATRQLRASRPDTAVVVLTTYADDDSVLAALQAGAAGYLTKDASAADIRRAIDAAAAGQAMLDSRAAPLLVRAASRDPAGPGGPAGGGLPDGLTEREGQVLALIADGLSNAEIAATLFVSASTVKTHINQIFAKTGSRDRPQAMVYARRHGISTPPADAPGS